MIKKHSILFLGMATLLAVSHPSSVSAQATSAEDDARLKAVTEASPVAVQLATDKKGYKANEPVIMKLQVKNTSDKAVSLTFGSGQKYNFEIRSGKQSLWEWAKGRAFTQEINTVTLEAGKTLTFTETYKPGTVEMPTLPDGTYTLLATLTALGQTRPLQARTTLTIGVTKATDATPNKGAAMTAEDALKSVPAIDSKYAEMQKTMDESEVTLKKSPDDAKLKTAYVEATYAYGHTVMMDGQKQPRVMYRAALALFRRALAVDPNHKPTLEDKEMLEGIYKQLGLPVPK